MGFLDRLRSPRKPVSAPSPGLEPLLASLLTMAWVVEARDPYTGGHLWRVSRFSRLLAEEAGLAPGESARIALGGFLHDLGKVGVPDAILRKPDRLTGEEYDVIKTHPEMGRRMLAGHPLAAWVLDAVYMHHETPDGRGYPQGLPAGSIPESARIVGLCDAFDAMTSSRPYRAGMPVERAAAIVRENLGRQFDGPLGERFLGLMDSPDLRAVVGHSDQGIPLGICLACGPIIAIPRETSPGERVACPHCTTVYELAGSPGEGRLAPTEAKATAAAMTPRPDLPLIRRLVGEAARHLAQLALPFPGEGGNPGLSQA